MSASLQMGFEPAWSQERNTSAAHWDELPTDGAHAWFGLILLLGSSVVAIRGLCWMAAVVIRLVH